ncbi:Lin1244/Lin1753 domain-containing protein [Arcobacter sp.]|uniref:Lin1244/Lin1753 domain-containing protein n=1 Tax=unclassified Arcobacter TaxID=2593671 RepID=UPI003B0040D9
MSKKESYYFPHYVGSRNDRKIIRVRKDFGIEGYALFFMTLERLREEESLKIPVEDIDILADDFGTSEAKLSTLIFNYKLFDIEESENGKLFFSPKQIQYLQPYFDLREQRRLAGIASGKARRRKTEERIEKEEQLLNECSNNCSTDAELINKEIKKEKKKKRLIDSYLDFKEIITKKYAGSLEFKIINSNELGLLENTGVKVKANGYLFNTLIEKDFTTEQAHKVWNWMFENQNYVLGVVE